MIKTLELLEDEWLPVIQKHFKIKGKCSAYVQSVIGQNKMSLTYFEDEKQVSK